MFINTCLERIRKVLMMPEVLLNFLAVDNWDRRFVLQLHLRSNAFWNLAPRILSRQRPELWIEFFVSAFSTSCTFSKWESSQSIKGWRFWVRFPIFLLGSQTSLRMLWAQLVEHLQSALSKVSACCFSLCYFIPIYLRDIQTISALSLLDAFALVKCFYF